VWFAKFRGIPVLVFRSLCGDAELGGVCLFNMICTSPFVIL